MTGVLEGLESSYNSPGMGIFAVVWDEPPTVGKRFVARGKHRVEDSIVTGTVKSTGVLSDGRTGFRTNRTTYVLREDA